MNLKQIGTVFTSKFVGTGPSSYKKEFTGPQFVAIYRMRKFIDMLHNRELLFPDFHGTKCGRRYIGWKYIVA